MRRATREAQRSKYIQGFSTSMPKDVQEKMVHSLPGLEKAEILRYAYAIEYDAIDPLEMQPSLENKIIKRTIKRQQRKLMAFLYCKFT